MNETKISSPVACSRREMDGGVGRRLAAYYHVPQFGLMHCRVTANRKSKCSPYRTFFTIQLHPSIRLAPIVSHSLDNEQCTRLPKFVLVVGGALHLRRLHSDFVAQFSFLVDFPFLRSIWNWVFFLAELLSLPALFLIPFSIPRP